MKTPLPKFPHHRGVPKHHFGVKTPLLATLEQMAAKLIFISLMVAGRPVLPGLSCCYVSCWQVGQMRFRAGHAWIWWASALAFRLVYFMRFHHSCYYLFIFFKKIILTRFWHWSCSWFKFQSAWRLRTTRIDSRCSRYKFLRQTSSLVQSTSVVRM